MTPEEAIELLKGMQSPLEDYAELVGAPAFAYGYKYVYPDPEDYAIEEAIEALKEIQQYREIGTAEEIRDLLAAISEAAEDVDESGISVGFVKDLIQLKKYREIGTVEECREAVEKQKPKAPKDSLKIKPVIDENGAYVDADVTVYLLCPNCGEMVGIDENVDKFCHECGQAIDNENWRE